MFRSYTEKVYRPTVKPRTPTVEEWFTCDLCTEHDADMNGLWRSETDLEMHRKEVHFHQITNQMKAHSERFCTVCMTLQDSNDNLITHIKSRHLFSSPYARRVEREIFICDHCSHVFFNKGVLEAHILCVHMWKGPQRMKKYFVCPKCNKFVLLKAMWFHLQQHEIPSVSVCDICLTACHTIHELKIHLKTHPMHYMCSICNYHTPKEDLFHKHLDKHDTDTEDDGDNNCVKKCIKEVFVRPVPSSFQPKYNLHHNFRGLIVPDVLHICVLCREICKGKKEMCAHVRRVHMRPLRTYKAPQFQCTCGEAFQNRVLLKHHAFKLQGAHRELSDKTETEEHTTNKHIIEVKEIKEVKIEYNARKEQNELSKQIEKEWQMEEAGEPREGGRTLSANISESVTLTCVGAPEGEEPAKDAGDGLVYIYATVNEDEMVTVGQEQGGQLIGF